MIRLLTLGLLLAMTAFPADAKPTPYHTLTLAEAQEVEHRTPVPARFDVNRLGIPPGIVVEELPAKEFRKTCGYNVEGGCSWPTRHLIVLDANLSPAARRIVLRHEYAHMLGWPEAHTP